MGSMFFGTLLTAAISRISSTKVSGAKALQENVVLAFYQLFAESAQLREHWLGLGFIFLKEKGGFPKHWQLCQDVASMPASPIA